MAAGAASEVWMKSTSDDSLALRHSIFGHRGAGGGEEEGNAASVSFARGGGCEGGGEDGDDKTLREVLRAAAGLSEGVIVLHAVNVVTNVCECVVHVSYAYACGGVCAHTLCVRDCVCLASVKVIFCVKCVRFM
jgi:hypothetical protein